MVQSERSCLAVRNIPQQDCLRSAASNGVRSRVVGGADVTYYVKCTSIVVLLQTAQSLSMVFEVSSLLT